MTGKPLFSLFVALHCLALWYTPGRLGVKKKGARWMVYGGVFAAGIVPVFSWRLLAACGCLWVLYGLLALGTIFIKKRSWPRETAWKWFKHGALVIAYAVAAVILTREGLGHPLPWVRTGMELLGMNGRQIVGWAAVLLLCGSPANHFIKYCLAPARHHRHPVHQHKAHSNTGGFIGTLERVLIAFLLAAGQYSAIGLVLSAKSIARYNKIAESQEFAEYYLLGTLLSTLTVIVVYTVLKCPEMALLAPAR